MNTHRFDSTKQPWEVFDATDGRPIFTTRWQWLARLVRLVRAYLGGIQLRINVDYARRGDGWIS